MMPEAARTKIEALSIEFSDESFFTYLKAGDREVVDLFLDAGFSPDLSDAKRTAAVVVAMEAGQRDIARLLLARGASPEPFLTRPVPKKDGWDKLTASSAVLSFISGLLIATVGGIFTFLYNERQDAQKASQAVHDTATKEETNKVLELEAVQKLIPMLASKNETAKAAALISIQDLAYPELAAHFAILFKGQALFQYLQYLQQTAVSGTPGGQRTAVQALSTIETSGTDADSKAAKSTLANVFDKKKVTISIEISETVDGAEAVTAANALRLQGYNVTDTNVHLVDESPHETTVRFFQYDRNTVAMGKQLVQILKDTGFTVRTEFDDEFVGDSSGPPPGTFEFWIGLTPSYKRSK